MPAPEIVFVAPFPQLARLAEDAVAEHGFPASVVTGDLYEGVKLAYDALGSGARVVISRGGTARLIQSELGDAFSIGVIEVEASVYSMIECLHRNASPSHRVGIIGFPQFTNMGRAVCESMDLTHRTFEIASEPTALEKVESLGRWRPDVILGDAISCRLMAEFGWDSFHLIESSPHSVREAFGRACLVLGNVNRQIAYNHKLAAVLECSQEGIVILDAGGGIEEMNGSGRTLIGTGSTPAGENFARLIGDPELEAVLRSGEKAKGVVVEYRNEQLILDIIPLPAPDGPGGGHGMVVTLQPVKRIQEMESKIRSRLHKKGFSARRSFTDIIHDSDAMRRTIAAAEAFAQSGANIVITGETGTGKEMFAQSIHNASSRAEGMFVAVNCSAVPAGLLESELFGYSPGAFTGALRSGKAGLFEIAHQGTLFLDEISELDLSLQPRLLRAIQEREIMRLGDSRVIPVDVRIIAASNRDLQREVADGAMREDLFFRLNVLHLHLPPLRERDGDARYLFLHCLRRRAQESGIRVKTPAEKFMHHVSQYPWPGNIRELENLAERYLVMQRLSGPPEPESFFPALPPSAAARRTEGDGTSMDDIVRSAVRKALALEDGNIAAAARRLDVSRNTVRKWLR